VSFSPTVSRHCSLAVDVEVVMGRSIGLDVHRDCGEIAIAIATARHVLVKAA
jgi:hypothetical protein